MNKKYVGFVGVVVVALILVALFQSQSARVPTYDTVAPPSEISDESLGEGEDVVVPETGRVADPGVTPPVGKLKADTFTGTLESVDTGCFADGECSIEVDGKHVTALMGWSRDTVGSVQGVEGFGDLEQYIGKKVEVYAQEVGQGAYTLYGSEGFYIKLIAGQEPTPVLPPEFPRASGGCVVGGCSSQLCVEGPVGDVVSTCEWREEYACYQDAVCERQTNGECGWTMTEELAVCLEGVGAEIQ